MIAADVPITLGLEPVQATAKSLGIDLISYTDLSAEGSLSAVASDSINIILMAEIIELITFNPVELWKEFSLRELQHYFCLLSPDFDTTQQTWMVTTSRFKKSGPTNMSHVSSLPGSLA